MFFDPKKEQSIFYEGRRCFLTKESDYNKGGYEKDLAPPTEFLTKAQMRRSHTAESRSRQPLISFVKEDQQQAIVSQKQSRLKMQQDLKSRQARTGGQIIMISKYSSTSPHSWIEELQAGCKVWVNKKTGEVSAICPWLDPELGPDSATSSPFGKLPRNTSVLSPLPPISDSYTTSSNNAGEEPYISDCTILYDHSEVEDLFRVLDKIKK